jgi:hypothetical protein
MFKLAGVGAAAPLVLSTTLAFKPPAQLKVSVELIIPADIGFAFTLMLEQLEFAAIFEQTGAVEKVKSVLLLRAATQELAVVVPLLANTKVRSVDICPTVTVPKLGSPEVKVIPLLVDCPGTGETGGTPEVPLVVELAGVFLKQT